jgi:hypothetical protein
VSDDEEDLMRLFTSYHQQADQQTTAATRCLELCCNKEKQCTPSPQLLL